MIHLEGEAVAKFLIVSVEGEEDLLLVDCEQMTVERIDSENLGGTDASDGDLIANTSEARQQGFKVIRGVDLAIVAESRNGAVMHARYASGA